MSTSVDLSPYITEELITYLGSGKLNTHQLASSINYSGLKIQDLDQLKELHFVLYPDVIEFVEKLPERIRQLKTVNRREKTRVHGEVRGSIDWHQTREKRRQTGYNDPTLFVVDSPEIEYDISENRVVKKLISIISRPLRADVESIDQDWRAAWDDRDIIDLQQTLKQNVYLNRLPAANKIYLGSRDLEAARQSRNLLYTEAHRLYTLYQDLINDHYREEVKHVLEETLVVPTTDATLFELFCIFAIIRRLRARFPDLQLQRVRPGMDTIARMESDTQRVDVYYNQTGPFSFFETFPSSSKLTTEYEVPNAIIRQAQALEEHEARLGEFLDRGAEKNFYQGRPDFLIVLFNKRENNSIPSEIVIGEIKYTNSKSTFSTGLRELLEYMYFVRSESQYLYESIDMDAITVSGVLCTDGVETNNNRCGQIEHITTQELQNIF